MKKKHKNEIIEPAMGMMTGGIALSMGSQALGEIGGTPATNAQKGLYNLSSQMPAMGSITGMGMTLKGLKKLKY